MILYAGVEHALQFAIVIVNPLAIKVSWLP